MKRNGAWERKSKRFRKKYPYCIICGKLAEEVHHIIPLTEGGTHDENNLVSLCIKHHVRIHELYRESEMTKRLVMNELITLK